MVPSSIPAAQGNGNRRASSAGPDDINILGTPLPALRVDLSGSVEFKFVAQYVSAN
jgi:hypothetical protein